MKDRNMESEDGKYVFFEPIYAILIGLVTLGTLVDVYFHLHDEDDIETFFTPWHAILYFGYILTLSFTFYTIAKGISSGKSWKNSLPLGYQYVPIGLLGFGLGGGVDLVWHTQFGFENNIENSYSPPHLLLMISAILFVSAPLISAWRRFPSERLKLKDSFPMLMSFSSLSHLITLVSVHLSPFFFLYLSEPEPQFIVVGNFSGTILSSYYIYQGLAAAGVLFFSIVLTLLVVVTLLHFKLDRGFIFIYISLYMLVSLILGQNYFLIPSIILFGIMVELLVYINPVRTGQQINVRNVRMLGFLYPFLMYYLIYLTVILVHGTWWKIHLWLGLPLLGGIVGCFSTFFVLPLSSKPTVKIPTS